MFDFFSSLDLNLFSVFYLFVAALFVYRVIRDTHPFEVNFDWDSGLIKPKFVVTLYYFCIALIAVLVPFLISNIGITHFEVGRYFIIISVVSVLLLYINFKAFKHAKARLDAYYQGHTNG